MGNVRDMVADIVEQRRRATPGVVPARYPFVSAVVVPPFYPTVYAVEFVIENPGAFLDLGAGEQMDLGQADAVIVAYAAANGESLENVVVAFADGCLDLHGFVIEPEVRESWMADLSEHERARFGLGEPATD